MSGKSFTDQMRRRKRRKKRQRQSHHDDDEEDLQSQDLLAGDDKQEPVQHQQQLRNEEEETENANEEQETENRRENDQEASSETKVQAEARSERQAANNHESLHEPVAPRLPVVAQAQQVRENNAVVVQNRMDPPPVHVPTEEEERLKGLLSHYINNVRNLERSNQRYQQELHTTRLECQKLKQALEKSRQKCKEYHKKYSDIKLKFYHWYNHFLQQWAAKFNQGETQDLPPGPDTVGGLSPPALQEPQQEHDIEDASVLSALQPRRIFQDNNSSSSGGSSTFTSPSAMAERNGVAVLPVQNQQPTESNPRNENLHPNVQAPVAPDRNETTTNDSNGTSNESKRQENDEMQMDVPSEKESPQKKDSSDAGIDEDETQLHDAPQENDPAKPKANETTTKADDASDESVCSDTQMVLPPEDASVQSSDDEDDETQPKFQDSPKNQSKSKQAQGHEQTQKLKSNVDARREALRLDQGDKKKSSFGTARRPSEAPPARKVSLSPNRRAPSADTFRPRPDESLLTDNPASNHRDLQREAPTLGASRRTTKSRFENKKRESMQSEQENEETSQALFSQLPPTPPQKSTTKSTPTASKERASSKNASALRAMEGWTSNVVARSFVQNSSMDPPAKKKQRVTDKTFKPDTARSNTTATLTGKSMSKQNPSLPKAPARNPYARANERNSTPKAAARMDWSGDENKDNSPARSYKYQEVVRCRHDRQQLPGHCCPECDKFAESLCQGEGADVFDKNEFLGMSRHRARHTPENTPPGFWELSFADEVEARKRSKDDHDE